jgi:signal recognition particle receptor subunit beta
MSFINPNAKALHCKIVYYGPSLGGKTTNVQWIYQETSPDRRSDLMQLNTSNERTLSFDFLPLETGDIRGYKTRFHLYTVPGQIAFDNRRKLVLKGLDGIIFVADSQADRLDENLQAMRNMETNLKQQGYDIQQIPMVIQYNKRDLPGALPVSELRHALNRYGVPDFEAVASQGTAVFETLTAVSKMIVTILKGGEI